MKLVRGQPPLPGNGRQFAPIQRQFWERLGRPGRTQARLWLSQGSSHAHAASSWTPSVPAFPDGSAGGWGSQTLECSASFLAYSSAPAPVHEADSRKCASLRCRFHGVVKCSVTEASHLVVKGLALGDLLCSSRASLVRLCRALKYRWKRRSGSLSSPASDCLFFEGQPSLHEVKVVVTASNTRVLPGTVPAMLLLGEVFPPGQPVAPFWKKFPS